MVGFLVSNHASLQLKRRQISLQLLWDVLNSPQQTIKENDEKVIYQSIFQNELGEKHLYRVFINI